MRTDTEDGKRTTIVIFDLDEQKMYMLDSRRKQADVWNLQDFADDMSAGVDLSGIQSSITPNGLTREIAGLATTGYDMEIIVPAEINAGEGGGMGSMMGDLMAKMGGVSATTEVQSVDTSPLTDDLFTVPAGYKLRARE
jgi:hypothetical protein